MVKFTLMNCLIYVFIQSIESSEKREQLMSVHFPHLVRLNGGTVRQSDTDTSETVYLRLFEHQENKPNM